VGPNGAVKLCRIIYANTKIHTTRCMIRAIARSAASRARAGLPMGKTSALGVGPALTKSSAASTLFCRRRSISKSDGLPLQAGKPKHLHSTRGFQRVQKSRDAVDHRQGFDGAAVAVLKRFVWP